MIHPSNHLERIKIKQKKDAQKAKKDRQSGRLWRAKRERDKEEETVNELQRYI